MALIALRADIGQDYGNGTYSIAPKTNPDPSVALAAVTAAVATAQGADKTAFEAALATLVADGASPTQAHVTAVNDAYTTLKAEIEAVSTTATTAALGGDVQLLFNAATVLTKNALRSALASLLRRVEGSSTLT